MKFSDPSKGLWREGHSTPGATTTDSRQVLKQPKHRLSGAKSSYTNRGTEGKTKQSKTMAKPWFVYVGGIVSDEHTDISRVRIGPRVKEIAPYAFKCCHKLVEVRFNDRLRAIGDRAFGDCTALRTVNLPSTVTKLGNGSFYGCVNLKEVRLNEGLKVIGDDAFASCRSLQHVTIPSTVTKLGVRVFHGCRPGRSLYAGGEISNTRIRFARVVHIGPRVKEIDPHAFAGCQSLANVQFNKRLRVIGDFAFEDCTALQSVTIPSTVTELGRYAFARCRNLAEVRLSEGLRTIGGCTFGHCTALRSVIIPSTVIELDLCAFIDCRNLTELKLNEGLQIIGGYAFQACMALRCVTIPSTVTKLGCRAFHHCRNLSEVILSDERFFKQEFLVHGLEDQGLLNQGSLDDFLFAEDEDFFGGGMYFAFHYCPLTTVKISIFRALSDRMERLPQECRMSVEERIRDMDRLEVMQDGNVLACFPVVSRAPNFTVEDTNLETARNLHQILQWIAFYELKESSILIELAMWRSRIDDTTTELPREDCLVGIPDPAKSAIMEYCGYAGFLEPASEG